MTDAQGNLDKRRKQGKSWRNSATSELAPHEQSPDAAGRHVQRPFDPLRELFASKLASGEDLVALVAVKVNGEMVVDLWGGWANEARTVTWTENTITCVFSITKTMTALAALALVDRSELDVDANVASRRATRQIGSDGASPSQNHETSFWRFDGSLAYGA